LKTGTGIRKKPHASNLSHKLSSSSGVKKLEKLALQKEALREKMSIAVHTKKSYLPRWRTWSKLQVKANNITLMKNMINLFSY